LPSRGPLHLPEDLGNPALLDVYGRVVRLLENGADDEAGRRISAQLTHWDIADRIGSSREMVSKILNNLRIGGYVGVERRRIVLKTLSEPLVAAPASAGQARALVGGALIATTSDASESQGWPLPRPLIARSASWHCVSVASQAPAGRVASARRTVPDRRA
jgi:hypothetical protein